MAADQEEFIQWVSDPQRTNDELFTVELLLEQVRGHGWPLSLVDGSFEARTARARERMQNPSHRPALHTAELRCLIERAETLKHFSGACGDDRPVRNLEALRFFPALESVSVQSSDVTDFRPVAALPKLQYLSIAEYGDLYGCHPISLGECGEMPELARIHLALRHPWPDLHALGSWPALLDINFNGNVLALEDLPPFPAARTVALKTWPAKMVALRNLRRLPEMPEVRQWTLETMASLEGIERFPSVVNLDVAGVFSDLAPLAPMEKITALTLRSERFHDLRPLARMARLREIRFVREWPLDLSPLADCAQLRRVTFEHCAMMRTEVAALNAGLLPEALDFRAERPRSLEPLKFYRVEKDSDKGENFARRREAKNAEERAAFYDGDVAFQKAEGRAFRTAMQAKFDALLGRGWGIFKLPFTSLKRYADTLRVVELAEAVREYSAQSRWPMPVSFIVQPHGDMSDDLAEIQARDAEANLPDGDYLMRYYEPEQVLDENQENRRRREERYDLLKREHLRRLRGEEAGDLLYLPEEMAPQQAGESKPVEEDEEPLTESDEGNGGVAIAPPPPPPPGLCSDLSDDLMFYLDVYEDCVVANSNWADRAEYTLGVPFVTWKPL